MKLRPPRIPLEGLSAVPEGRTAPVSQETLCGRDIVCFSHDFHGDPLSKNHLMRLLSRENRVLWVNSIGYRSPRACRADAWRAADKLLRAAQPLLEVEPNLFVLNPIAIPAYGGGVVRAINRRWLGGQVRRAMRRLEFARAISWVFNPAAAVVAGALGEESLIYHCVDEYTAFAGVSAPALAELEGELLRRADLVIVSADRLRPARQARNPRTVLVRHGVDFDHFRRALDPALAVPLRLKGLPRPVVGYFGLISEWVDLELLAELGRRFASGSVVAVGRATVDVSPLERAPNVHLVGRRPYEELPAWCKGFDVAVIPFRVNELTMNANPLKAREYLAAGLPVVSTPLPEVARLPGCRTAEAGDPFCRAVDAALADPGPRPARSEAMRGEGWAARLDEIRGHFRRWGRAAA
jgi:glycosyltransferase involved in cell wall biosynthesis